MTLNKESKSLLCIIAVAGLVSVCLGLYALNEAVAMMKESNQKVARGR